MSWPAGMACIGGRRGRQAPQMVACELPPCNAEELQRCLFERHSIEVAVQERRKHVLLRASFQVYNNDSDLDRLVDALASEL